MSVMSIRIDDQKRKALKVIASIEGKSMGRIVSQLIDSYIEENRNRLAKAADRNQLNEIMKLSESSFMEWDNEDDEIYNDL